MAPRDARPAPPTGEHPVERPSTADADAAPDRALGDGVSCPFCDRLDTELVSPFGGQLSVAQYWCRHCRTGFDYMKWA